ncbi:MAG: MerR family transcriptional regulator, partial [Anaerotignaceae bacterium]
MSQEYKFSIREVSEICNIPSKTLRYYDEIELVVPEYRDEVSRYRYYSKNQLVTLCIIKKLRTMDFSLKEIQNIINENKADDLEKHIEMKLIEILDRINCLQKK